MTSRIALLIAGVVLFAGCKKKFDIVPADVEYMDINGKTDEIVLNAGTNYSFGYRVNDNSGVDYITMKVSKGFEFEGNVTYTANDFFFANGFPYDQTVKTDAIAFNLPQNITSGSYRIGLLASDNDNNNSVERFLDFIVTNGKEPVMNVNFSTTSDNIPTEYQARRSDNLMFNGTVTSDVDLTMIKVQFIEDTRSVFSKVFYLNGSNDTSVDLKTVSDSMKCFVDPAEGLGKYNFVIHAVDASGEAAVKVFKVRVDN